MLNFRLYRSIVIYCFFYNVGSSYTQFILPKISLDFFKKLRGVRPDIAITTDIIVGFPGETENEFNKTLDLLKTVEFDGLFGFIYSDRPGVPAAAFKEKLPEMEKKRRLQILLDLQDDYTRKKNNLLIGSHVEVLVENTSGKNNAKISGTLEDELFAGQWMGRTTTNKIVNFDSDNKLLNNLIKVRIKRAYVNSLWGECT